MKVTKEFMEDLERLENLGVVVKKENGYTLTNKYDRDVMTAAYIILSDKKTVEKLKKEEKDNIGLALKIDEYAMLHTLVNYAGGTLRDDEIIKYLGILLSIRQIMLGKRFGADLK